MTSYGDMKTIKAKIAFVKTQLQDNDAWLLRGLLAVYARQTADEQQSEDVKHHNNMGFTPADGPFMCSVAGRAQRGWQLSAKQIIVIRRKMNKYAGQLVKIADGKL